MINNKKVELCEEYKIEKDERLKITLVKDKPIKDMSHMFYNCDYLSCIKDESKWNTDNVIDMNSMFYGCIALDYLPKNISEWNTSEVTDFSKIFYKCECLKELPGISKWNTGKVNNLSGLFSEC